MQLTTKTRFKTYAGISGTTDDALIEVLLSQVSDLISQQLGISETNSYREWLQNDGEIIRTTYAPIQQVYGIYYLTTEVAQIYSNRDSDLVITHAMSDEEKLILSECNSDGEETEVEIDYDTYKTLSTLKTAVEMRDWTLDIVSGYENYPSANIKPISSDYCVYPNKVSLYIPDHTSSIELKRTLQNMIETAWTVESKEVFVRYKAGYTMPTDEVDGTLPAGLELLFMEVMKEIYLSRKRDSSLSSESIGDYSYSKQTEEIKSIIGSRAKDFMKYKVKTI